MHLIKRHGLAVAMDDGMTIGTDYSEVFKSRQRRATSSSEFVKVMHVGIATPARSVLSLKVESASRHLAGKAPPIRISVCGDLCVTQNAFSAIVCAEGLAAFAFYGTSHICG
jgi:hypothetical protein